MITNFRAIGFSVIMNVGFLIAFRCLGHDKCTSKNVYYFSAKLILAPDYIYMIPDSFGQFWTIIILFVTPHDHFACVLNFYSSYFISVFGLIVSLNVLRV